MFTNWKNNKIPLRHYWTTLYAITLIIGLAVLGIISVFWIRHTTFENRLNMLTFMAEETADQIVRERTHMDEDGLLAGFEVRQFLEEPGKYLNMKSDPEIYIVNEQGEILYSNTRSNSMWQQLNPAILYSGKEVDTLQAKENHATLYMVKKPIITQDRLLGWVVFFELKDVLSEVDQEYKQLFIMIAALGLLGWLAIYLLSGRLAKPITEVAKAAEQVKNGNYTFVLSEQIKEKEVYELIHSFKEMAAKLNQLETLRTELLAGVTHELKTPVTSISGLIQAVSDHVVVGKEADEFLSAAQKEALKMKLMVEDLLAFNQFVADAIPTNMEVYSLNEIVTETVEQWELAQENNQPVSITALKSDVNVHIDELRLQQIMTNLLNNAAQSMGKEHHMIWIVMGEKQHVATIDVQDKGIGIPQTEQAFIFERFYRGENKKFQTSGFGLGLPFSKMLAQAMGGDLILLKSSSKGTTFRLQIPIREE